MPETTGRIASTEKVSKPDAQLSVSALICRQPEGIFFAVGRSAIDHLLGLELDSAALVGLPQKSANIRAEISHAEVL